MIEFLKLFSNREIAILIWGVILFGWVILSSKGTIKSFYEVIKLLFSKYLVIVFIIILSYFSFIIYILNKISIWEFPLYKDFIYWFFANGTILLFHSNKFKTYNDFSKVVLKAVPAIIIIEYIVNFYNFSLLYELVLVPILSLLTILSIFIEKTKKDENSKKVADFLNKIISIIGTFILVYVIYRLINSYDLLFTISNLKSFFAPLCFTLFYLPLLIFIVLYMKYERLLLNLNRYEFISKNRKNKIKFNVIRYANVSFDKIEKANNLILFNKRELKDEFDIALFIKEKLTSN